MKKTLATVYAGILGILISSFALGAGFFEQGTAPAGGYPSSPTFVHWGSQSGTATDNLVSDKGLFTSILRRGGYDVYTRNDNAAIAAGVGPLLDNSFLAGKVDAAHGESFLTRPVVDVRAYGPDTSGVADSSAALQAAHDALPASGGAILLGKGGDIFRISSTVNLTKKVYLKGWGRNENPGIATPTKLIKSSTLNGVALNVTGSRSVLEGFTIEGESGNGGDGILLNNNGIALHDISVHKMGNDGVRVGVDPASGNQNSWYMRSVTSDNNVRHGFYFHSGNTNANAGTGDHLEANNNGGDGFYLNNARSNVLIGPLAEFNAGSGLHLGASAWQNVVIGGDLDEANVTRDATLDSGSQFNILLYPALQASKTLDSGSGNSIYYVSSNFASQLQDASFKKFMVRRVPNMTLSNGSNDNVAIPNGSFSRVLGPTTDNWVLLGIAAGQSGERLVLSNNTGHPGKITMDNSSIAAQSIRFSGGSSPGDNTVWPIYSALEFIYDDAAARWYVISK